MAAPWSCDPTLFSPWLAGQSGSLCGSARTASAAKLSGGQCVGVCVASWVGLGHLVSLGWVGVAGLGVFVCVGVSLEATCQVHGMVV